MRMQREKCISKLAPDHYKNSPFGKRQRTPQEGDAFNQKIPEFGSEIEITPLDLSNDKKRKSPNPEQLEKVHNNTANCTYSNGKDQPLDLSRPNDSSISAMPKELGFNFDKTSLYEIARKMGLPKETIDKEMAQKFEEYVRRNLRKSRLGLKKNRKRHLPQESATNHKTEIENRSPKVPRLSEQVAGLEANMSLLPVQTLNNGDLTITPVLSSVPDPVETSDIIRVNSFFQNQLWQPELIGLSSWKKLRSQSFDI